MKQIHRENIKSFIIWQVFGYIIIMFPFIYLFSLNFFEAVFSRVSFLVFVCIASSPRFFFSVLCFVFLFIFYLVLLFHFSLLFFFVFLLLIPFLLRLLPIIVYSSLLPSLFSSSISFYLSFLVFYVFFIFASSSFTSNLTSGETNENITVVLDEEEEDDEEDRSNRGKLRRRLLLAL